MAPTPGERLGPYEILERLGSGGMGEVYRAHDPRLGRDIAIKVLLHADGRDEGARRRLIREARLAAQLNHPHICTIFEVGESDGLAYIAMEWLQGRPLDAQVGAHGLPPATAVRYGIQIADALAYAHEHGVIHRDLKCANVLITHDGRVKVADFGLAKRLAGETAASMAHTRTVTESGAIVGTPHYLAPEVLRGAEADARSDVWALGVVLYELVSGARPFRGVSAYELGAAILNEPAAPLPARVPRSLAAIIARCLAKDPVQRYRGAGEVRAALEGVALDAGAASAPKPAPRMWPWVAAAVVVLVTLVIAFDVGGLRSRILPGAGAGRIASVAVLPLDNLSGDPAQQYFADGMTEELITALAQTSTLRVTSRTSVMGFRGTTLPLPTIARKLGVDAIVEGSVARAGDRVRITAQLIRAASDRHLWAQSYERDLRDVLALQDEVAGAIAQEVRGRLAPQDPRIPKPRPVSPQAYELYLRGIEAYRRWEKPSDRAAAEYLRHALALDSTYAPAWAALGLVYIDEPGQFGAAEQDVAHAREFIDRALALDPGLGLAHEARGEIVYRQDWNWSEAEREFQRAIQLSPNLFEAHHLYSHLLMTLGRPQAAFEQARAALELDPLNSDAVLHMGWYFLTVGQVDRAVQQFRATLQLDPGFAEAYRFLAMSDVLLGHDDDARADQGRALALTGAADTTSRSVSLRSRLALNAVIAARHGDSAGALRMTSAMIGQIDRGGQTAYDVALVYAQLGRSDDAFHWLDRSLQLHEKYLIALREDPLLTPLRADPRFAATLRKMGLPT